MGSMCQSCSGCGESSKEFVFGSYYLEPYQVQRYKIQNLNKYDKFYRIVADPFYKIKVEEYIEGLDDLIKKLELKFVEEHPNSRFNCEQIPYVQFLEHYKTQSDWKKHINDVESPFMRLLQLDKLFFTKKVISTNKIGVNNNASAEDQQLLIFK